jgi:hypothetical protein
VYPWAADQDRPDSDTSCGRPACYVAGRPPCPAFRQCGTSQGHIFHVRTPIVANHICISIVSTSSMQWCHWLGELGKLLAGRTRFIPAGHPLCPFGASLGPWVCLGRYMALKLCFFRKHEVLSGFSPEGGHSSSRIPAFEYSTKLVELCQNKPFPPLISCRMVRCWRLKMFLTTANKSPHT